MGTRFGPITALVLGWSLCASAPAAAQATSTPAPAQQPAAEANPTGLPRGIDWKFNFDATWGTFGFNNSLFQNPREGVPDDLSDQWLEGSIKPALSGSRTFANSSVIFGKVSAVGERTYGSSPAVFGGDISSFSPDEASIGWRSGTAVASSENLLEFEVGRAQYRLGHGMLLYDGSAEGGSRGGYWTNARKAFEVAAIGRVNTGPHKFEAFYLDKDELPEGETGTRLTGVNYQYALGDHSTFGATYMTFFADKDLKPARDGMDVFNVRAYTAPIPTARDVSFEFEYASERNADLIHADAWTFQAAYQFSNSTWKPKLSYRFASFQGDDPSTARNENFDPLLPGFSDWGSWWQGEIVGEYIALNQNLISKLVRLHLTPNDKIGAGMMFYSFTLDKPAALAPNVTNKGLAGEFDAYVDWKVNKNVLVSLVGAYANPGPAADQAFNRTKNFSYGMVFVAYSY
jgi:hypothetical protein